MELFRKIFVLITILTLIACVSSKDKLNTQENETKLDLKDLKEVREYLNGYWIVQNSNEKNNILWLEFNPITNLSCFAFIPKSKVNDLEIIPNEYYDFTVKLIEKDSLVKLEMNYLFSNQKDTLNIDYLSREKLELYGIKLNKLKR